MQSLPQIHASFETGQRVTTDIIIERGLVRDPVRALGICARTARAPRFVLTDRTVGELYGAAFVARLRAAGYPAHLVVMPDGEQAKSFVHYHRLAERILERGIDENSELIALGGGVVGNVTGMLAATLYRGIGFVQVPTTLMAQADAAISHKQAINGVRGKNLVGTYYAPRRVVVDVEVLQTLEARRVRDGMAEVIKHAVAQDAAFVETLLDYVGDLKDPAFLEGVVRRNVALKCALMATDPQERHAGMVLQYGHAIGHAVEHQSGFDLLHGEAVAIGMLASARIARRMGVADAAVERTHRRLNAHFGLPTVMPAGLSNASVLRALRYDKRATVAEGVRMALVEEVGRLAERDGATAIPVPSAVIAAALDDLRGLTARAPVGVLGLARPPANRDQPGRRAPRTQAVRR